MNRVAYALAQMAEAFASNACMFPMRVRLHPNDYDYLVADCARRAVEQTPTTQMGPGRAVFCMPSGIVEVERGDE